VDVSNADQADANEDDVGDACEDPGTGGAGGAGGAEPEPAEEPEFGGGCDCRSAAGDDGSSLGLLLLLGLGGMVGYRRRRRMRKCG